MYPNITKNAESFTDNLQSDEIKHSFRLSFHINLDNLRHKEVDMLHSLYTPSFGLLTDLYQLTMGYGYFKHGLAEREAIFNLFFRKAPFGGQRALCAGLQQAIELIERFKYTPDQLDYLAGLKGNDQQPLFDNDYLRYLESLDLNLDIDAIPEGTLVSPNTPLLRIKAPLIVAQLLETPLLTILNFQTLIATKAARITQAAQGDTVLEFGLRRAQGIDGGISASRAAYIGGVHATSNVLAGQLLGIPCKGTHAHAWVMTFPSEMDAFEHYAQAMPNNCIFLVDTYDTIQGVKNAITIGQKLKIQGHKMIGIRLDSGNLLELSRAARVLLDEAGFQDSVIVASDSLYEHKIAHLKANGSPISVWGVGTNLVTAKDQPALGGVYKLAAIKNKNGTWEHRVKRSNTPIKVSNPGKLQVERIEHQDQIVDILIDELQEPKTPPQEACLLANPKEKISLPPRTHSNKLLKPIMRSGKLVTALPSLESIRNNAQHSLIDFNKPVCVVMEQRLADIKNRCLNTPKEIPC